MNRIRRCIKNVHWDIIVVMVSINVLFLAAAVVFGDNL